MIVAIFGTTIAHLQIFAGVPGSRGYEEEPQRMPLVEA
jgi:hypothetical protein